MGDIRVEILRGKDVLRAFNYTGEIDLKKMDWSCCHFKQGKKFGFDVWGYDPEPEWFDFYAKNPKNFGMITMFEDDEICGRSPMFEGVNLYENLDVKEGKYYKFLNSPYLYEGNKYRDFIRDWAKKNDCVWIGDMAGVIFIKYGTKVTPQYPPVDWIHVNVDEGILASRNPNKPISRIIRAKYPKFNPNDYLGAYKLNIIRRGYQF